MLSSSELRVLAELFAKLNTNARNVVVNSIYKKYTSIQLHGKAYGSSGNRPSSCPYVVLAFWNELYYGPPLTTLPNMASHPNSHERPVNVHYYVTVTCTYTNNSNKQECQEWNLARVSWFYPHSGRYDMGNPAELWYSNLFEAYGTHLFAPLELSLTRCAHGSCCINDESLLVIVPLV